ncbi:thiamine pyrophosphate enzyme, C-terminal TPP binding domain protein, partial [Chlamydia psittaci 06-1683]|jgi:hypothetical protein
LSLK